MNLWELSENGVDGNPEAVMSRATVFQVANGYMGYRGTLDEFGPTESVGITLAGLYDQVGSAWREPVNAPNGGYTEVIIDGQALSALDDTVESHRQTLRFANALFERETVFRVGGKRITIRSGRFLSAATPNLGVVRFSLQCDADAEAIVRTGIDGSIWDLNGPHLPSLAYEEDGDVLVVHGFTHESAKRVAVAESAAIDFGERSTAIEGGRILRVSRFSAKAGTTYTFHKYFAVVTDNDSFDKPPLEAATDIARLACERGYAACADRHDDVWQRRWCGSDVVIDGDDEAQLALRYSILQLLMAAPPKGSARSIPARALSGQVYKGAVFWDTELFMLPFYLHTDPEVAAELLRYRIRTLDGARRKARTEGPGYRGAFYAWESQETGDDACSYFNVGDPITGRAMRTHFRDKQIHISGDIAIAFWRYFQHTGDDTLLLEGGAEVVLECARFYLSYAYFKKDKHRYELLDVIGPDEYHERVNNNAFTNRVAKETFAIALSVVEYLRHHRPGTLTALLDRLDLEDELADFAEAAELIYVPQPDPESGLIEQFDGYFGLRDTTPAELKSRRVHPNEYLGAGQGLAVPTQVIKQADVVMMLNLFKDRYDAETMRANWEYYEPRTEHGSSLSACAYAMVALEFGGTDFAYRYFLKTAKIDLEAKYKLYAGTVFIGGSHPAANGGAWMTAVLGFGGVRATADRRLSIRPRLPDAWTRLQFPLSYQGGQFVITITPGTVKVTASPRNGRAGQLEVFDQVLACAPGKTVTVDQEAMRAADV